MYQGVKERVETRCKYCGGYNIVKFGHFKGIQRWWCKDCKRKFVDNDALLKRQEYYYGRLAYYSSRSIPTAGGKNVW